MNFILFNATHIYPYKVSGNIDLQDLNPTMYVWEENFYKKSFLRTLEFFF